MSFIPTPQQEKAITTIDRHVAVTAGAGSGKTRVLVERYLNLLEHGVAVENIAAITFTKKAAQEMKDRLCKLRPDLIAELEQAQISTIHSLCQRIIQEHPLEAAVDPRFRIGEEWETQILLLQTIEDLVDGADRPEALGNRSAAVELIRDLYEQMMRKGDLNFRQKVVRPNTGFSPVALRAKVEEFLQLEPHTNSQRKAMEELAEEWPVHSAALEFAQVELQLEAMEAILTPIKKISGKFAEEVKPLRYELEEAQQYLQHVQAAEIVEWLGEMLEKVHENFTAAKRSRGLMDFNDLEHLAYQLLLNPSVREDFPFDHLMVDEFQDTNPLQKKIVDAFVSGGSLLFVVGDPKQSIYRFRGADVGVFMQTKEEVAAGGEDIFLAENFRSRPELIQFANMLFAHLMAEEAIGFQASAHPREKANRPCVTLLQVDTADLSLEDARRLEAEQIALKIRELVEQGRYDYKDISILFRAMTNAHLYEQALQEAGVPYVNLSGRGFYSRQEIQDVLNYFRWLQDPGNEVARLAVLRSPFYLISDDGLYWLSQDRVNRLSIEEQAAYNRACEDYQYLVKLAETKPAPEVITAMLDRTDYAAKTFRLPFGPQKKANIEKLLRMSWDLFANDIYSVPEQLRYIELMSLDTKGEGEAQLEAEHANVVILRTVHGSKGLEFPVAFLADTCGDVSRSGRGMVRYHPDFGLVCKGMHAFDQLKEREEAEELSEAKRLLYVAFTRAQEEVFWCVRDGKGPKVSWWAWLEEVLDELPPDLYTWAAGNLTPPEVSGPKERPLQLEVVHYDPLPLQPDGITFSVTSLMYYVRCPRCFYNRYILGIPELGNSGAGLGQGKGAGISAVERGNIVHRVCEQITDPANLDELIAYAAAMEGLELTPSQTGQIKRIIEPYLTSNFFRRIAEERGSWEIYREKDFLLPVGSFFLNGLVDQVFVSPAGLEIVDFKSNSISREQVQAVGDSYLVQLRLYAWAMHRLFGVPVLSSQAYFLIPNEVYTLDESYLDVATTEDWIQTVCTEIVEKAGVGGAAFPAAAGCRSCSFGAAAEPIAFGEGREDEPAWAEEEYM